MHSDFTHAPSMICRTRVSLFHIHRIVARTLHNHEALRGLRWEWWGWVCWRRNAVRHKRLDEAVGRGVTLAPQVVSGVLAPGDAMLLCSDGLTKVLRDEEIGTIISEYGVAVRCCRALTERVCALGGQDNVTVALMRHLTTRR